MPSPPTASSSTAASFVDHNGNMGALLHDLGSDASIRAIATSIAINANNISISAGSINAQVSQRTSPQDLAQQPGMAWMNQLMSDPALAGKVNWQRVQEVHDQWDK